MVVTNKPNLSTRESLVIETTKDFTNDLNNLTQLQQKQVEAKLQRIEKAIETNNNDYLFKHLKKIPAINLSKYTSSLHLLKVNHDLRIFLFYEDDPIFNRQVMTLIKVCFTQDLNKVLKGLCESFYQENLNSLGEFDHER